MVENLIESFSLSNLHPAFLIFSAALFLYAVYVFVKNLAQINYYKRKKREAEDELKELDKKLVDLQKSIRSKRNDIIKRTKKG